MTEAQLERLKSRISWADHTHGPADDSTLALGAIHREVWELTEALQHRLEWEVKDEFLDVAVVALRRWMAMEEVG